MHFEDLKANAAEALRVAGTLFLVYALAALPFFIFGTAHRASDFAMLGLIAVPVFGGALVVLVGLLAVYLTCLPVRLVLRLAVGRRAKPKPKSGGWDGELGL
jgi:hypothetical protein